ncbi:ScbR family autoregulator-binding transcription factor [Streptomyces sp. AJS327]|uniref:ScbR family autoregulator-binding transcription factor n=1 Tax=Streptomyces sp. AJS327 TaxID=2545265 RepID=UPI0027E456AB|nr:ScbR family autoregulator-binding transcription factor [Streptomyces sp. AJS327]
MAQQERAIRTRNAILAAAAEVFDEYHYEAASITDILNRAGVTKGALYFHFPSKEALAQGVMAAQARALELRLEPAGLQTLIDINLRIAHEMRTNTLLRAGVRLSAAVQRSVGISELAPFRLWTELFSSQLTAAKEKGELLQHVDPQQLARLIVSSYTGVQQVCALFDTLAELPEQITALWRVILPGIAVPGVLPHLRLDSTHAELMERQRLLPGTFEVETDG